MPVWVQWFDFSIGILGFGLTIWTLLTARSVKKQFVYQSEYDDFKKESEKIRAMLQANICSIRDDNLYLADKNNSFRIKIRNQIFKIKSQYSFLSHRTQKFVGKILRLLDSTKELSDTDWRKVADNLNLLMDELQREDIKWNK